MAMPPLDHLHMTGQARFRRSWSGRLILQVEEPVSGDRAMAGPSVGWRDATEDDLRGLRRIRALKKLEPLL
jgi:hypothetical protein